MCLCAPKNDDPICFMHDLVDVCNGSVGRCAEFDSLHGGVNRRANCLLPHPQAPQDLGLTLLGCSSVTSHGWKDEGLAFRRFHGIHNPRQQFDKSADTAASRRNADSRTGPYFFF